MKVYILWLWSHDMDRPEEVGRIHGAYDTLEKAYSAAVKKIGPLPPFALKTPEEWKMPKELYWSPGHDGGVVEVQEVQ